MHDIDGAMRLTGFYGKLPYKSDFVQRGMDRAFINQWDLWLRTGLHASQQILGADWRDAYLRSPIWYFILGDKIFNRHRYVGLMLPSQDSVGRCFPFAVFIRCAPGDLENGFLSCLASVEACLADLLEQAGALDQLHCELERIARTALKESKKQYTNPLQPAIKNVRGYSLWWDAASSGAFLRVKNLPDAGDFITLLNHR